MRLLATVLAILGLYGVMAYTVTRRAREIAIRMALGGYRLSVVGLVIGEVLVLAIAGVAVGLPCAVAVTRIAGTELDGVQPNDLPTLIAAAILLTEVALAAYLRPGCRQNQALTENKPENRTLAGAQSVSQADLISLDCWPALRCKRRPLPDTPPAWRKLRIEACETGGHILRSVIFQRREIDGTLRRGRAPAVYG